MYLVTLSLKYEVFEIDLSNSLFGLDSNTLLKFFDMNNLFSPISCE
jgi:hypothetical protein